MCDERLVTAREARVWDVPYRCSGCGETNPTPVVWIVGDPYHDGCRGIAGCQLAIGLGPVLNREQTRRALDTLVAQSVELAQLRDENTKLAAVAEMTARVVGARNHHRDRAQALSGRLDWMQGIASAAMRQGLAECRRLRSALAGEGEAMLSALRSLHANPPGIRDIEDYEGSGDDLRLIWSAAMNRAMAEVHRRREVSHVE